MSVDAAANGASVVLAAVEIITPQMAAQYLEANGVNRRIREPIVAQYARDMAEGKWHLHGQGIQFDQSGRLVDGQHRLKAVIRSGVHVGMLVVRGLNDDAQEVLDSGSKRSVSDALRMRGETNYAALAAAAALAMRYETKQLYKGGGVRYSHSEVIGFVEANPDIRWAVERATRWQKTIQMPTSALSLLYWILGRIKREACDRFFTQLAELTGLSEGDPVLALHRRLSEIRAQALRRRATEIPDYISLVIRAWNYWREGRTVKTLPLLPQTRTERWSMPVPR